MQFFQPDFLYALTVLLIPVLIHLFNFRRYRKEYFTNVTRLEQIQTETHRNARIKEWLILFSRLLMLASLVIAFAQPFIPDKKSNPVPAGKHAVSIYLDNSLSMEAGSSQGQLLEEAKVKVRDILDAYKRTDIFQLLTADFYPEQMLFYGKEDLLKQLNEVKFTGNSRNLDQILRIQSELLKSSGTRAMNSYIISDFQKSTTSFENISPDTAIRCRLIPIVLQNDQNLFIDSIFFGSPVNLPGQVSHLHIRIRNTGEKSVEKIPVKLFINSKLKNIGSADIGARSFFELTIPFTEDNQGTQYGRLEISDYPVTFDDQYYFAYQVRDRIPVCIIEDQKLNPYLSAVYSTDSVFKVDNYQVGTLNYSKINSYPLIVLSGIENIPTGLSQLLSRFVADGGSLVVFPHKEEGTAGQKELLNLLKTPSCLNIDTTRQRISGINFNHPVFQDVFEQLSDPAGQYDLPTVFNHFLPDRAMNVGEDILLWTDSGDPILVCSRYEEGKVYLFTVLPDDKYGNLHRHMIFVPVMVNLALQSINPSPLSYLVQNGEIIRMLNDSSVSEPIYTIKNPGSSESIIPEVQINGGQVSLNTHDQIRNPGFYEINAGEKTITGAAFNYPPGESFLDQYSMTELDKLIRQYQLSNMSLLSDSGKLLTDKISSSNQGQPLWKIFIILSLLFAAFEILLIRFFKG